MCCKSILWRGLWFSSLPIPCNLSLFYFCLQGFSLFKNDWQPCLLVIPRDHIKDTYFSELFWEQKVSVVSEGEKNCKVFYMTSILGLARLWKEKLFFFFFFMCVSEQRTHSSLNIYFLSRGVFYVCTWQNRYKKLNEVVMNIQFFWLLSVSTYVMF